MNELIKSNHSNGRLNDPLWIRVLTFLCKGFFFKDDSKPDTPVEEGLASEEVISSSAKNREAGLRKIDADGGSAGNHQTRNERNKEPLWITMLTFQFRELFPKKNRPSVERADQLSTRMVLLLLSYPIWGIAVGFTIAGFFESMNLTIISQLIFITTVFTLPISLGPIWIIRMPMPIKIILSISYMVAMAVPVFVVGLWSLCYFSPNC